MFSAQNRPRIVATGAIVGAAIVLISLAIVYGQGNSSSSTSPYGSRQVALQTSPQASPGASPIAGGQPQTAVTLQIIDFGFSLSEFTIPANTDVTITLQNTGQMPHTFVLNDHNNPNVQNLNIDVEVDPGETETVTVNAPPGDYSYYCRLPGHEAAGMHGIMHVQ